MEIDELDRAAGGEAEVGEIALVELDAHVGGFGLATHAEDLVGRGLDHDHPSAEPGQGHRVRPASQLDHPPAGDVAAEAELGFGRHARAVGDGGVVGHRASVLRREASPVDAVGCSGFVPEGPAGAVRAVPR